MEGEQNLEEFGYRHTSSCNIHFEHNFMNSVFIKKNKNVDTSN